MGWFFLSYCRHAEKPIVALRGGKSQKGADAAMSHTASLAGNGAMVSGALAQVGVVEAHKLQTEAKELGFPFFGELYRAVECMAGVLCRTQIPDHGAR